MRGRSLALLAYPLLIEPRLGLGNQRGVWAVGYAMLVVLIAWAAWRALPDIIARPGGYFLAPEQRVIAPCDARRGAIDWPTAAAMAAAGGDPIGSALRGDELHRHGPRVGTAPVGAAAGDLSRLVHRRVLASWRPADLARRRRGPGHGHDACGCHTDRPAAGRSWSSWPWSSSPSPSSRSPCTDGWPRIARIRTT